MYTFDFKNEINKVPEQPGVYRYFDDEKTVIYVGKAKNLKHRVSSYFNNYPRHDKKTKRLVDNIRALEYTIAPTEFDALLLENTLIKQFQPKYNILLRDDKHYPFILVTNERFPRLEVTRKITDKSKGKLYGPFTNVKVMYALLDLFKDFYTIRSCNLALSEANIKAGKFKVCLEYHLKNCKAPCIGLQEEAEYVHELDQVHHILKGNLSPAKSYFEEEMLAAAAQMAFENAHRYKLKLEHLSNYSSRATVVNPSISDLDVFTIISDENAFYTSFLKIQNGTITTTDLIEVKRILSETEDEILPIIAFEIRSKYESNTKEIISNISFEFEENANISVPQIGDKRKLIEMSLKNVQYFRRERVENATAAAQGVASKRDRILVRMKQDLQLKKLPRRIECFDNSNIQGTNPVSAMVCFINGQPSKRDYRHFIPRTVIGPDDFATMKEAVFRRYSRLLEEEAELPDLIIVDGGKGQLSSATDALKELKIYGKVPIIGIAKRLEEIYFPEDSLPLYIDKKSETLKLIQRCRDEAHRFGITHHRNRRSQNFIVSQLEEIPGIAKGTTEKLLKHFKSISNLKAASDEDIIELVGKDKLRRIKDFFKTLED